MVHHGAIFLIIALVQTVAAFQTRDVRPVTKSSCKSFSLISDKMANVLRLSATTSDVEQPLEVSDVRRMIDESAVSLMKRFWEIDLQTQRRMDMILRLYEVFPNYRKHIFKKFNKSKLNVSALLLH